MPQTIQGDSGRRTPTGDAIPRMPVVQPDGSWKIDQTALLEALGSLAGIHEELRRIRFGLEVYLNKDFPDPGA